MKPSSIKIGQIFGRWTVISFSRHYFPGSHPRTSCTVKCQCGTVRTILAMGLLKGTSKSCGCLQKELAASKKRKHDLSYSPEYAIWKAMKSRCYRVKDCHFKNYGARGIYVCDRWKNSFENFYADMGLRPSPEHSIDRKNNDQPYSPENCRWATEEQQNNNKRTSRLLTFNGRTQTLTQWAYELGFSKSGFRRRLVSGWSVEEILTLPHQVKGMRCVKTTTGT